MDYRSSLLKRPVASSVRYSFLPAYPTSDNRSNIHLLFSNVQISQLSRQAMERRLEHCYHQPTFLAPINDHERLIFFLSRRWNINREILEYNFQRVTSIIDMIMKHRIHHFSTQYNQENLLEDQYSVALEFFLQIDIDTFYLKTCSYRGAIPESNVLQSLFCLTEPQGRYPMEKCNQISCCLCNPSYKMADHHHHRTIVKFGPNQQHFFINGYRSILNCPATCTTRNIIYVLTCPCHQVDYIGETSLSLENRLAYHRTHGNRIVQEFLLGPIITSRIQQELKSFEVLVKDGMKLYQHSTHCSMAIQWFLDENPEYWPFIPIQNHTDQNNEPLSEVPKSIVESNLFVYANDVPSPPPNFHFTHSQKIEIDRFFLEKKYLNSPNQKLDLYEAAIVAILPTNASAPLRRFIEALLITHTEAKLNTEGHLDKLVSSNTTEHDLPQFSSEWCQNLIHRTKATFTS
ncbi:unnamed protein product [Rotaria magnacalcarata]|uniref:Uncharacterized protein n=1 Tax=Rotaria magnacalcarata TaxID=392030 RepID=A0A816NEN2_9BILA|nr:unnamed protein product [Rotaria magnacalcarata]CAF1595526.1 unnamed protein product [Rotaria magnacalcarata]CAF2032652.1 unnamed protein product [Rotaria magnacalcarata]CAF4049654.1 unnamed protein product [Rotaria magnacalcarata]CAF4082034.1 unnamed protein product [Rotaria magnacalcarata]